MIAVESQRESAVLGNGTERPAWASSLADPKTLPLCCLGQVNV